MIPFPRSTKYDHLLVKQKSVGGNILYSTEALANHLSLKQGMRVLDLGSGMGLSSVFLANEYGVTVWTVDSFFSPTENFKLAQEFELSDQILPIKCDARNLPMPECFFDCIIIVNSYYYFGTDDKYLPYLARFLKPNGQLGISDICFRKEINKISEVPSYLKRDFAHYWQHVHSIDWWSNKWQKTGLVDIDYQGFVNGEQRQIIINDYIEFSLSKPYEAFAKGLQQDKRGLIDFFVLTAIRNDRKAFLEDHF